MPTSRHEARAGRQTRLEQTVPTDLNLTRRSISETRVILRKVRNSQSFGQLDKLQASIYKALKEYEDAERPQIVPVIHGDTVFSNGILTEDNTVCFLDMRGMLGKKLTLAGDLTYDLAKTYQSLVGYDFMLLDQPLDGDVRAVLAPLQQCHHNATTSLRQYCGVATQCHGVATALPRRRLVVAAASVQRRWGAGA